MNKLEDEEIVSVDVELEEDGEKEWMPPEHGSRNWMGLRNI